MKSGHTLLQDIQATIPKDARGICVNSTDYGLLLKAVGAHDEGQPGLRFMAIDTRPVLEMTHCDVPRSVTDQDLEILDLKAQVHVLEAQVESLWRRLDQLQRQERKPKSFWDLWC